MKLVNKPFTYAEYMRERRLKRENCRPSLPDFSFVGFSKIAPGKICKNEIIEEMLQIKPIGKS